MACNEFFLDINLDLVLNRVVEYLPGFFFEKKLIAVIAFQDGLVNVFSKADARTVRVFRPLDIFVLVV